jgi:hypothetical protein
MAIPSRMETTPAKTPGDAAPAEERRQIPWGPGKPRERRRPRWGEFRDAYPRIVTAAAIGMVALLALDLALLVERSRWNRELTRMRGAMTEFERRRADALVDSAEDRTALMIELVRRQALGEAKLNLSVDVDHQKMALQREGAQLREMKVRLGPEQTVGEPPAVVKLVPPRGRRTVVGLVDGSYRWEVPEWVYIARGLPVPADRSVEGALGPSAILLDGGTVIYSRPAHGPLADPDWVLPGGVRAEAADLDAIAENLKPGVPVYFY